ncbi:MAG: hypothetical protein PHR06_04430 [Candidatus Cloacimonetes bacterium]|nr:hypothetical protein [Candidatus Cloacimonadota bacterium]
MKHRLILIIILLSLLKTIFAAGFSSVKNNEIEMSDYSFETFQKEFNVGMRFICVLPNKWRTNVKDTYEITEKSVLNEKIRLELRMGLNLVSDNFIEITPADLKEFRGAFIERLGLTFENGFPVKVLKVKTAIGDEIEFYSLPGGTEKVKSKAAENVIYYPFKQRSLPNGEKWLYLCNSPSIDIGVERDIENKTIGWVKYIDKDGNKMNVVLWNTNLGILPEYQESYDKVPLVFKKSASYSSVIGYYLNSIPSDRNDLISDETNIKNFIKRIKERNGNVDRWLPMYNAENVDPFTISVGVLDSMAIVKQSLVEIVTQDQIKLAIMVDETLSMRRVWENLDQIMIELLKNLSETTFRNLQDEQIEVKIRLYAFGDEARLINKDKWISTPEDVQEYAPHLKHIANNLYNSKYFEPLMLKSVKQVLNDKGIKNTPVLIVVIGDCGDYEIKTNFHDHLVDLSRQQLVYDLSGVLFLAQPERKTERAISLYNQGHELFRKNVKVIKEIGSEFSKDSDVKELGESIANEVTRNVNATINAFDYFITKGSGDQARIDNRNLSIFANRYLLELTNQLQHKTDTGTYFEEGKLYYRPSNIYEKLYKSYVFIEKTDLESFKFSLIDYMNVRGKQQFRDMLRDILATFFGKNIHHIQDDFLQNTTIFELWEIIVGNKEIAQKLVPSLFDVSNTNFYNLVEQYDATMEEMILDNATTIRNRLDRLQNEGRDKIEIVVYKGNTPEYKTYFWVEADDINIFKGMSAH